MHGYPWVNHSKTHRMAAMHSLPMYTLYLSVSTVRLNTFLRSLQQHSAKQHCLKTQPQKYTANIAAHTSSLQKHPKKTAHLHKNYFTSIQINFYCLFVSVTCRQSVSDRTVSDISTTGGHYAVNAFSSAHSYGNNAIYYFFFFLSP